MLVEGNFDVLSLHARGVLNVVAPLRPKAIAPGIAVYPTPAPEFELSELRVQGRLLVRASRPGPEILLVTEGSVELVDSSGRLRLEKGQSAFVRPKDQPYTLDGVATLFRASVGDLSASA